MKHYKFLMNNIPVDMDKLFTYMRLIALLCAFMINFLLLFDKFTVYLDFTKYIRSQIFVNSILCCR